MTLQAVVSEEDHGKLDAMVQGHYRKQEDGGFILDVGSVGGLKLEDVSGLSSALGKERAAAESAGKALKALQASVGDLDLNAARDAVAKIEEMGGATGEELIKKQVEAARGQLEAKFARDKVNVDAASKKAADDLNEKLLSVSSQLSREMITSQAATAIAAAKGSTPSTMALLMPLIMQRAKVEEQNDGTFAVRLYDAGGNPLFTTKAGQASPMNMAEFIEGMRNHDVYAPLFNGTSASGAGGGRSGKGVSPSGKKRIAVSDQAAMSANILGIADGTVEVYDDSKV